MGSSQFRAIVRRFYKRRHSRDRRQLTTLWTSDKSPRFLTFSSAILFLLFLCKLLSRIYICPDGFQKLARKPKNIGDSGVRYDGGYYLKTIGLFRDPSPIPAERFLPHIKVYYAVDIYLQSWSLGVIKISKKGFLLFYLASTQWDGVGWVFLIKLAVSFDLVYIEYTPTTREHQQRQFTRRYLGKVFLDGLFRASAI